MKEHAMTPWQGDWQARLQSGIERLGFARIEDFLMAYPADTYYDLVKLLDSNVAPMQLYAQQLRNAQANQRLREASADCLARFLAYYGKRGWGNGRHFLSRSASAYAAWKTSIIQCTQGNDELSYKLDAVWKELEKKQPPNGWIPQGASDSFIQAAFASGWPTN